MNGVEVERCSKAILFLKATSIRGVCRRADTDNRPVALRDTEVLALGVYLLVYGFDGT